MGAALSVINLVEYWKEHNVKSVLDYGAGNLRNTIYLQKLGFMVFVVETPDHIQKIKGMIEKNDISKVLMSNEIGNYKLGVDLVLCNFVLNYVDDEVERMTIIQNAYQNLKLGGFFLLEVKERRRPQSNKGFVIEELDNWIVPVGFEKIMVLRRRGLMGILYNKY